jgi:hypothetical protein
LRKLDFFKRILQIDDKVTGKNGAEKWSRMAARFPLIVQNFQGGKNGNNNRQSKRGLCR